MLNLLLDGSGVLLLLSGLTALIYEFLALTGVAGTPTISSIVWTWGKGHPGWLGLIILVLLSGLSALGIHFLGGF